METITIKMDNVLSYADPYGMSKKWDFGNASHLVEIMNNCAKHLGLDETRCTNPKFIKSEDPYGPPVFNFEYDETPQEILIKEITDIIVNHSATLDVNGEKYISIDIVKAELEYLRFKMNVLKYEN